MRMRTVTCHFFEQNIGMTQTQPIHQVQIHLTIHQSDEDLHVDFPFDTETDSIQEVVAELVTECKLTENETAALTQLIQEQINKTAGTSIGAHFNRNQHESVDSDNEEIDDQEYKDLMAKQKRELEELDAKHQKEQRELALRLQSPSAVDDLLIF